MRLSEQRRPLITIILLCYNHENFVAEAVDGVLSQTYSPLEIMVFDDCSTDRTAEIIESAISQHPLRTDIRFIRNPKNMHSNAVVRTGLGMTRGDLIVLSCGDDIMLPTMVEEMAEVWIKEKVSLVTANAYYIDENSKPLNRTFRDPDQPADDSFETLARDGANACCFGPAIGFERSVYDKFGWVPRYLMAYDIMYPFYASLLKGARFINKPLLKYRVHKGNTSVSLNAERANPLARAAIEERAYLNHLTHAVLMEEVLDQLRKEAPDRYGPIAERIMPLLAIQMTEMLKKLVRSRRAHSEF